MAKITELPFPFHHHSPISPLGSRPSLSLLRRHVNLFFSTSVSATLRVSEHRGGSGGGAGSSPRRDNPGPRTRRYPWDDDEHGKQQHDGRGSSTRAPPRPVPTPSPPWLQKWTPPDAANSSAEKSKDKQWEQQEKVGYLSNATGRNGSIERIVHRLRNLGLDGNGDKDREMEGKESDQDVRLGDLLERSWNRPDAYNLLDEEDAGLPWERSDVDGDFDFEEDEGLKKKRVRAPTLAELTIEDSELRRLRTLGMTLRERISIPKAGVTQAIVEKIHDAWRKSELVRLKFHETLAHDMKTAHELVERRTGGLIIWRAGSVMVVYRGSNYERPVRSQSSDQGDASVQVLHEVDTLFVPDVSKLTNSSIESGDHMPFAQEENKQSPLDAQSVDVTEEEAEYNRLLDGLGPRFVDWWGTGFLPIDADLLPQNVPGYRTPFRLLPTGMRLRLTNAELTNLRKLARKLPCHFALGRNRNHHGLAAAIVKLWEKSLVVKIAVKRGIQNTNNKLMAEELKKLTGGILLLRNKYYIVIYRGKDFLPTSVAAALAERQELTKDIQDVEEKVRNSVTIVSNGNDINGHPAAGTLAEFREAQARWGREISDKEREEMKAAASRSMVARFVKRIEHKLSLAEAKKQRAEKLLAKIESSMVPVGPSDDQEAITDEERSVFRRIGLRMKAYLPLGIRGVFDGVIENMHLHWKHRELVKLISKQKTLSFVEDTARLLEYESGGILVAIERVPKGYALIYYRGKNYQRPISIRPRNLLTKAKALKRSVAMQRHEALSQHISELERTIEQYQSQLGDSEDGRNKTDNGYDSQFSEIDDKDSDFESEKDFDEEDDSFLESDDSDGFDIEDKNSEMQ